MLKWRYGLDTGERKTQQEVALELGISRSYVSRIEKNVLSKISREFLASSEYGEYGN